MARLMSEKIRTYEIGASAETEREDKARRGDAARERVAFLGFRGIERNAILTQWTMRERRDRKRRLTRLAQATLSPFFRSIAGRNVWRRGTPAVSGETTNKTESPGDKGVARLVRTPTTRTGRAIRPV